MKLRYKAVSQDGKIIRGFIEAGEITTAADYLRDKNYFPIKIEAIEHESLLDFIPFLGSKIGEKDVILFTRQLSLMLNSGLSLIKSLEILKNQSVNRAMTEVIDNITTDIQEGASFARAISKYDNLFSPIYMSLIKASELSGLLDRSLSRLADNLEKQQQLKNTIRAAFTYPVIIFTLMIIVVFIMMIFVIPKLTELYKDLNVQLPLATKMVIGLSNFTVTFWPLFIVFGFVFLFLLNFQVDF